MTAAPTPNLAASLGQQLRTVRKQRGLTQAELAEAADVRRETVSRIERDPSDANLDTVLRLAQALGVRVNLV